MQQVWLQACDNESSTYGFGTAFPPILQGTRRCLDLYILHHSGISAGKQLDSDTRQVRRCKQHIQMFQSCLKEWPARFYFIWLISKGIDVLSSSDSLYLGVFDICFLRNVSLMTAFWYPGYFSCSAHYQLRILSIWCVHLVYSCVLDAYSKFHIANKLYPIEGFGVFIVYSISSGIQKVNACFYVHTWETHISCIISEEIIISKHWFWNHTYY